MTGKTSRRGVLKRAGLLAASVALRGETVSAVMATLNGYMSGAHERALPDVVLQGAKHHILDTVAAMVSGSDLPPGKLAIRFARAAGSQKIATVVA